MRTLYLFRIRFLFGIFVFLALCLLVRLYDVQIMHGEAYARDANKQYVRTAQGVFDRGDIYFTQKDGTRIAGASTHFGYMLTIDPTHLENPEAVYTALNTIIPLDHTEFLAHAQKKDDPYEEVAHRIAEEDAQKIKALHILGVQLYREQWRHYQGNTLAGHLLGFVGFDDQGNTPTGKYGLERYWNSVLARDDSNLYVNFFAEIFSSAQDELAGKTKTKEGDVVTSIEPTVQAELEKVLAKTEQEWKAKKIGGVIINPKTGAIYALGALPTFDPNMYAQTPDQSVFRDPIVEDVHEMGSIIKPLAMAVGLDTGAVNAQTTYNDTGHITINGYKISNYDGRARGVIPLQQILSQSLNVGMAFVTQKVGGPEMANRLRALGFGEETGIDLPFEARGLVDNLKNNREVEYITASFGQGIALTPIQTVRALCALGNGGYLVSPHIVQKIAYAEGGEGDVAPTDTKQVFSKATSEEITRMLVEVVDKSLRNGTVKKEHYSIAAKTGTAQIAKVGERGYYDDRYLHSFFGYFPAYNPQFLIFLYHVEPQGAQYASETLTAPFMELVDFLINYYEIPPDR